MHSCRLAKGREPASPLGGVSKFETVLKGAGESPSEVASAKRTSSDIDHGIRARRVETDEALALALAHYISAKLGREVDGENLLRDLASGEYACELLNSMDTPARHAHTSLSHTQTRTHTLTHTNTYTLTTAPALLVAEPFRSSKANLGALMAISGSGQSINLNRV